MPGSFRLFRCAGVTVYLHWTWLLVAAFLVTNRQHAYSSPVWNALEYLALFGIVLLHEYGHALACRQVGGRAERILLWPLGGVAYVDPPPRPGPVLWSLVGGPLVNVVLVPILWVTMYALGRSGVFVTHPDLGELLWAVNFINVLLLIFNLLPIYPLDGGQILRSLLWFRLGPRRSLLIASGIGLVGVVGLVALAIWAGRIWTGVIAAYLGLNCWNAFKSAREDPRTAAAPPVATDDRPGAP